MIDTSRDAESRSNTTAKQLPWKHPTGCWPEVVDLVALGETAADYLMMQLSKGHQVPRSDEIWTVNRGLRAFASDVAFVLDELASEAHKDPVYGQDIDAYLSSGRPIITTRAEGAYGPGKSMAGWSVNTYPARAVLACFGMEPETSDPYWHNSIPMVLAYACAIGVKTLRLWGADYTTPDGRVAEADRANCEHWIGRCMQRGMTVALSSNTTLCNRNVTRGRLQVYGLVSQEGRHLRKWLKRGPSGIHNPSFMEAWSPGQDVDRDLSSVERIANLQSHRFDGSSPGRYCQGCGCPPEDAAYTSCEEYGRGNDVGPAPGDER